MLRKRVLFGVVVSLAVLGVALVALSSQAGLASRPPAEVALTGEVRSAVEGAMEGVVVTAKGEGSTIAVSVISDAQGRYHFPGDRLEAGRHALSIRAVGYDLESPKAAEVGASGTAAVDLVLRPTEDLEAQLTNAEWLESIPGTEEQKRMFESCVRCHTLERVMRSQYDAEAWLLVLGRMDGYVTSAFPGNPQRLPAGQVTPFAERSERRQEARRQQAHYLASINLSSGKRGYDLETFPRPTGRATQVIMTEYDLPNPSTALHDAEVGPDGMVWYVDFGRQYLGKLDPRTGAVTEYDVPEARPGNPTGILALKLDRDGNSWGGNMFQGSIFKFDRRTEEFQVWRVPDELEQPKGAHGTRIFQINHAAPESSHVDGKVWLQNRSIAGVHRLDLATGEFESFEPFLGSTRSSHNLYGIQPDSHNNLWFMDFANEHIGRIDAKTGEIKLYETPTFDSRPRRGEVDSQDRVWYAGFGGNVIGMFDPRTEEFQEWIPPPPRTKPYDTHVDRNGDVWTGSMFTDRAVRLTPATGEFVDYLLPEKGVNIRRVYVDDSTTPVTLWIGSNHGASLMALQALDGELAHFGG
jgi:virginiamycin B lyase